MSDVPQPDESDVPSSTEVRTEGEMAVFDCPRCRQETRARFYGPCAACYEELRATLGVEPKDDGVADVAFEPKMNVTPNAVALKE